MCASDALIFVAPPSWPQAQNDGLGDSDVCFLVGLLCNGTHYLVGET